MSLGKWPGASESGDIFDKKFGIFREFYDFEGPEGHSTSLNRRWLRYVLTSLRSVHQTVRCRLRRVQALVSLGLVGPASEVILGLLTATALPDPMLDSDLIVRGEADAGKPLTADPPAKIPPLDARLLPGDAANRPAIAAIADPAALSPAVDSLYGSWAVARLNLARAAVLTRLGAIPNLWKSTHPETGERAGCGDLKSILTLQIKCR